MPTPTSSLPYGPISLGFWSTYSACTSHTGSLRDPALEDQWSCIRRSPPYCSKKAYSQLLGYFQMNVKILLSWSSQIFCWLFLKDRLNTSNILRRKRRLLGDHNCPLCTSNSVETLAHLFFTCSFSQWCWPFLNVHWKLRLKNFQINCHCGLWGHLDYRNEVIFDDVPLSLRRWKVFSE